MAYGIIRVRNLKVSQLATTDEHNSRRMPEIPENIDPSKSHNNYHSNLNEEDTIEEAVLNRIHQTGAKIRSNSNVAIEFVATVNDQKAWEHYSPDGYFSQVRQWLGKKYGHENIVSCSYHHDESNPHAHFILVPVREKEMKWKNRNGSGVRKTASLCARDITGGPEKLKALQSDYYQFVKGFEHKMGVKFYRGTAALERKNFYSQKTNHLMAEYREALQGLSHEEKQTKLREIQEAKDAADKAEDLAKYRAQKNKGDGWKKGFDPFPEQSKKKKGRGKGLGL